MKVVFDLAHPATRDIKDFDNIELFGIEAITPSNFLERIK